MSKLRFLAAAALGMSLLVPLVPSAANASSTPDATPYVTVSLQAVNGTGCPPGSTSVIANDPGTAFTVLFSQFKVQGGDFKNCQAVVKVSVPTGWSYTIYEVDNRGFAQLEAGATGMLQSTAYFTGFAWTMKDTHTWNGPYIDSWQTTSLSGALQWSPCGRSDYSLSINDIISVTGPTTSAMALFSKDVSASTIFYLRWRAC